MKESEVDIQLETEPSYKPIRKYEKEYKKNSAGVKIIVTAYSSGQNELNVLDFNLSTHETATAHVNAEVIWTIS